MKSVMTDGELEIVHMPEGMINSVTEEQIFIEPEHETGTTTSEGFVMIEKKGRRNRSRRSKRASNCSERAHAQLQAEDTNGLASATMAAMLVAIAAGGTDCGSKSSEAQAQTRKAKGRAASASRRQPQWVQQQPRSGRAMSAGPRPQRMHMSRGPRR
mmetsp:Transcript_58102/g.92327  ORF Transcript_58102/g.92327 Transcript_58102/m.92327 type:complete len:157 (+) Transcript_58102:125-595(+)